jgi:hypothetical protein
MRSPLDEGLTLAQVANAGCQKVVRAPAGLTEADAWATSPGPWPSFRDWGNVLRVVFWEVEPLPLRYFGVAGGGARCSFIRVTV